MEELMRISMPAAGRAIAIALVFSLLPLCAAYADSGDSSGNKPDTKTCGRGEVWDSRSQRCVKAENGVLPDKNFADNAYALTKAGRYAEALAVLNLMKDPNTAVALNYRGYLTRRMGRVDEGIGYYLKSVALDPHYAQVREYLGEAYLIKGDMPRAEEQLHAIKKICGTTCEEYRDLLVAMNGPASDY
jgi:tetratricopeptide (TPR) repeat protein